MPFLLMLLHHRPRSDFLGATSVPSGALCALFNVFILPLLLSADASKMLLAWHIPPPSLALPVSLASVLNPNNRALPLFAPLKPDTAGVEPAGLQPGDFVAAAGAPWDWPEKIFMR
jgi:hypothetical protein